MRGLAESLADGWKSVMCVRVDWLPHVTNNLTRVEFSLREAHRISARLS